MKRLLLLLCACLVLGAFLVYQMQNDSGYVLVVWGDTSIEMSIWFGLALLLALLFVLYIVITMIRGGFRGIHATKQKITGYSSGKAQQQTIAGLIDFIEGDWSPAHKKLTRAAKKVSSPIINYLVAARCAYEMNNEQEALQLLHKAEKSTAQSDLAVALTQARMQLSNQQFEQALATLARAEKLNPNHTVILTLQQQVYVALKDWPALKRCLPRLHQKKIGSVEQRYHLEKTLYQECMADGIEKSQSGSTEEKYTALQKSWNDTPKHFQKDKKIISRYVNELIALKKYDLAEDMLSRNIQKQWCDEWVATYGLIVSSQPEMQLKKAEKWQKDEAKNASLQLALGRLCLQNNQWGRAKDFLLESLRLQPQVAAYAELARLYRFLGAEEDGQKSDHQGLLYAVDALVEVPALAHG
jgi:HemY protein